MTFSAAFLSVEGSFAHKILMDRIKLCLIKSYLLFKHSPRKGKNRNR